MSLYSVFINVVPYVCLLLVIVLVHELGHFLVGRWCGVGIHAFSPTANCSLVAVCVGCGTFCRTALS